MRLKFLTLALVIGISSPVLSMDTDYDADNEFESRKSQGKLHYLHMKIEKITETQAQKDDSEWRSLQKDRKEASQRAKKRALPEEKLLSLKVDPISLPKSISRRGRTIDVIGDPLKITITLADGKFYECGSEGADIDISDFEPMGNRSINRFDVHVQDIIRHLNPEAQTLIHKNNRNQSIRGKFTLSSSVTDPTIHIEYDRRARRLFVSGLWPEDRRPE